MLTHNRGFFSERCPIPVGAYNRLRYFVVSLLGPFTELSHSVSDSDNMAVTCT